MSLNLIKLSGSVAPDKIPSREEVIRVFEELCVHRRHNTVQHQIQELTQNVLQLPRNCDRERSQAQRESAFAAFVLSISQAKIQARNRHWQTSKSAFLSLSIRALIITLIFFFVQDCMEFLSLHSLTSLFDSIVTMDDAPLKPSPEPIHLAMQQVGGTHAIMFGDTKVIFLLPSMFPDPQRVMTLLLPCIT